MGPRELCLEVSLGLATRHLRMEQTLTPLLDEVFCAAVASFTLFASRRLLVPFGRLFFAVLWLVLELEPSDLESLSWWTTRDPLGGMMYVVVQRVEKCVHVVGEVRCMAGRS